ncbi:MAG: AMP-dependent synthetase, partial [Acidimicrobiaceae bacterium]|nr:AMP-dependent synthetase [Acidimicrobiaceae bacterium]
MKVPLTVRDHIDRALAVYPDRVAFVDEPDQPAPSMGEVTFARMGELVDATGAGLDALGVPMGGRVAMVSHNAGRLLTCFWG